MWENIELNESLKHYYTYITYENPERLCLNQKSHPTQKSYQLKGCSFYSIPIGKHI